MTFVAKIAGPEPQLTFGRRRDWGLLSAQEAHATPGRYAGRVTPHHRVIFYLTPAVPTDCRCEGVGAARVQAPYDFDVVPAGASGHWEDQAPCDMISVSLAPELLASTAEALAPAGRVNLAPRLGAHDLLAEQVGRALSAELAAPLPAGRLYADSLAAALATRLVLDFAGAGAPARQTLSKPQLRRIVELVEARLDTDLTLAEVAAAAGISVPHLTSLFRRTMGQSVHAYVMERRVQRARALLLAGRTSIAQVALQTGFAHQSHLARWMRRLLGVTPSQVRRA